VTASSTAKPKKTSKKKKETPLMTQYLGIKEKYPEALLLFRVGDFYETFGPDAVKTSQILGIVLTKRNNGSADYIELAGFPHHSLDTYLPKLVRAGQRVAICDQLEDPKMTKTIVKRGVTELVTPGVSYNDEVLDQKTNNFLAAVHFGKREAGVAFLDISTGEFIVAQGAFEYIDKLLQSFRPSEVLFQKQRKHKFGDNFGDRFYTFPLEDWVFTTDFANDLLLKQFGTSSLKGFGIETLELAIVAAGAALHYLAQTHHSQLGHIAGIARIEEDNYVWLDRFTIRNLELLWSPHDDGHTLIEVMDQTVTPMGGRMLKRWMVLPLKEIEPIQERLSIAEYFLGEREVSTALQQHIARMGDLERLISKVAVARINPRELLQLKHALQAIIPVKEGCSTSEKLSVRKIAEQLNPCQSAIERLDKELSHEPPALLNKGNVIREGVNKELDELRAISGSGKDYLEQLRLREIERTGIPSLKVAFNNVFGYYLEVRNSHKDKVPEEWIRKQTLVNAERYITEELKTYETKILGAEEKISILENRIYTDLVLALADYILPIQNNAQQIARLDCLLSFAEIALRYNYTKPSINDTFALNIKDGRHPVIEQQLPPGEGYIANDVYLDNDTQQIIMITGPNMSGKSALLRQTALLVLMAQMGSFVPAKAADLGLVDKVFTRVGASDNLSAGESTFMVEMNETASILNNLSNRSLILLDEIGRGTSTYDGISIAWSIAEFLHEQPQFKAKTLFATHYHELNEMANTFPRIQNFNVSIKEMGNKVLFMRKLVPGGSAHSFGIHVAKMAGMPRQVIERANKVLKQLEQSHSQSGQTTPVENDDSMQLSFFQLNDPVLEQIRDEIDATDIDTLTPIEALMKLNEIKKLIGRG